MNLPLASRHGAASAGVENSAIEAAASITLRIMSFLPPLSRRPDRIMVVRNCESQSFLPVLEIDRSAYQSHAARNATSVDTPRILPPIVLACTCFCSGDGLAAASSTSADRFLWRQIRAHAGFHRFGDTGREWLPELQPTTSGRAAIIPWRVDRSLPVYPFTASGLRHSRLVGRYSCCHRRAANCSPISKQTAHWRRC